MNTAPLTGVPRRVPVRLVTVDSGGALAEVTEHIGCESANTQALQVSSVCHVSTHLCTVLHGHCPSPFRSPGEQLLLDTRTLTGATTAFTSFDPTTCPQRQV